MIKDIYRRYFSLEGKTALITGANGGIGRVLAVSLAEAGAMVAIHDLDEELLEAPFMMIQEAGGSAIKVPCDLADVKACRQMVVKTHQQTGRLDILINCAAMNRRNPIKDVTQDDFDSIFAVNLRSIFFTCQATYPIMCAQGGGKIIHISSLSAYYGLGNVSVYGIAKAALSQLTKVMAVEWAKDNIQVNALAPGFFITPMTEISLWEDEKKATWLRSQVPMRRPGQPEELVGAVLFMASDASSYMTGHTILIDGGVYAGGSWDSD
jgi:NAD(P)-dependent dehydrogenase (short-subunit alcohol dehydrogenase family)